MLKRVHDMKLKKAFILLTAPALLAFPADALAQKAETENLSRQVNTLSIALKSWKAVLAGQLDVLDAELSSLRADADRISSNQSHSHSCANNGMLFNGSSCIPLQ